jgi:hypothetical protein
LNRDKHFRKPPPFEDTEGNPAAKAVIPAKWRKTLAIFWQEFRMGAQYSFVMPAWRFGYRPENPSSSRKFLPGQAWTLFIVAMNRRVACAALLCAWLCASGAMLDLAQVVAWARMFAGNVRTETITAAAKETFDPTKPCGICRAISKAREESESRRPTAPAPSGEKIILIHESPAALALQKIEATWPDVNSAGAAKRCSEVPVPPPRGVGNATLT